MTRSKTRSNFLPTILIVVAVVICAGVVMAFLPIMDCTACLGVGTITVEEMWVIYQMKPDLTPPNTAYQTCANCDGVGKVSLSKQAPMELTALLGKNEEYMQVRQLRDQGTNSGTPIQKTLPQDLQGASDGSKLLYTKRLIQQLANDVELFHLDHERYPRRLADLVKKPAFINPQDWPNRGYLTAGTEDGWGRDVTYTHAPDSDLPYDLVSLGKDGKEGGTGFDEEISYRDSK